MSISVLLADDHTLIRGGLVCLLEKEPDLKVLAGCFDGEEALKRVAMLGPRVCIAGVSMPGMTGIELARQVRDRGLSMAVVVLSVGPGRRLVRPAIEAGALGFLVKESARH